MSQVDSVSIRIGQRQMVGRRVNKTLELIGKETVLA
jgi:hypothetical protein